MSLINTDSYIFTPAAERNVILRAHLINELNIDKPLIILSAPAGYGKTTLIKQFLNGMNLKQKWVNIPKQHVDPLFFLRVLCDAIAQLNPAFGNDRNELFDSIENEIAAGSSLDKFTPDVILFLCREIEKHFIDSFYIVLDDAMYLEPGKNEIGKIIEQLCLQCPPCFHFFVSARFNPSVETSNLQSKRKLLKFDQKNFTLSSGEIVTVILELYDKEISPETAALINQRLEGWIAGLHFIMQDEKLFNEIINPAEEFHPIVVNDFFEKEVFNKVSDEWKIFVCLSSYLSEFDKEMCSKLMPSLSTGEIIDGLFLRNLYIVQVNRNLYKYSRLFSNFIKSKGDKYVDKRLLQNFLTAAAEYFLNRNEIMKCLSAYLIINFYNEALDIIKKHFYIIINKFDPFQIEEVLRCFPSEIVFANPYLLYLKYKIPVYGKADMREIENDFNKISVLAEKENDYNLCAAALILQNEYYKLNKNSHKLLNPVREMLNKNLNPEYRFYLNTLLGFIYYQESLDKHSEARLILEKALKEADENGLNVNKSECLRIIANVFRTKGSLDISLHYYNLLESEEKNIFNKARVLFNIISLYAILGKSSDAEKYFIKFTLHFNKYPLDIIKRFYFKSECSLHYETGDFEKAIVLFEELIKFETEKNSQAFLWLYYASIAESFFYLSRYENAMQYLSLAGESVKIDPQLLISLQEFFEQKVNLYTNFNDQIEKKLIELEILHEKNEISNYIMQERFCLAYYYLKTNNPESAQKSIKKSLDIAFSKGFISQLEIEMQRSMELFDFAYSQNIHRAGIRLIAENIRKKTEYHWLSPEFHTRLKRDIEKMTDLRLLSFGNMELYLRGEVISDDKWIRKKSKIILAYLLANEGIVLTKDKAIDMFFPELPVDKAEVAMHSTVYNIRTAVKIYDIPKEKTAKKASPLRGGFDYNPEYIIYEDKMLRLNKEFFYEADNVKFEKLYHKVKLPSIEKDEKIKLCAEAIELYKGEFLPGNYESWCEEKRIDYKNMFIDLGEELIVILKNEKRYDEAIKYSSRLIAEDNINEKGHLCLVSAYAAMGNINMARDRFSLMLKIFDEELGEKPSAKTLNKIKEALS